jgi:hypothetical protein
MNEMTLMPMQSPRTPPMFDRKVTQLSRCSLLNFKIVGESKKISTVAMSFSKAL